MQGPDITGDLTAPRSEHLGRKSSAVVNGRWGGRSLKPLPSACLGSEAVQTADGDGPEPRPSVKPWEPRSWSFFWGPRVHPPRGPQSGCRPMTITARPTPQVRKGTLCQLQVLTPTREAVCRRSCFAHREAFIVCRVPKERQAG